MTDDGLDDLVVICKMEEGNRTIVVTDKGDSTNYDFFRSDTCTGRESENFSLRILIRRRIEIIITGEKNGAVGYAIYRMNRRPTGGSFWRGNGGLLLNAELVTLFPQTVQI